MPGFAVSMPMSDDDIEGQIPQGTDAAPVPFWSAVGASAQDGLTNQRLGARDDYLATAYQQRDADIQRRTGEYVSSPVDVPAGQGEGGASLYQVLAGSPDAEAAYEAKVDALRAKYPTQMAGVPTGDQVRGQVADQLNAIAARAQQGAASHPVGAFFGGVVGGLADPLTNAAMVSGVGEGAPIAMRMLMQSGLWGSLAAVEAPGKAADAAAVGGPAYGLPQALADVGGGLAAGPIFEALHAGGSALFKAAVAPVADRLGALLRSPAGDAERGALNVLDGAQRDSAGVGPLRSGSDFDAGLTSLETASPPPPIEPSRDIGELFAPAAPAPGPGLETAPTFAASPPGSALFERAEYRGRAIYAGTFDPAALKTDAATFQYKSDGDAAGVTDRLRGVQAWDPTSSGKIIAWQGEDGALTIADGHQRLGLAGRMADKGFEPRLDGYLFREADGWRPQDVRTIAALKNIREGQGNPLDAAKVFRDSPSSINDDSLPVSGDFIRQAKGLARLSPDAFGMVVNKVIPERYGAIIGDLAGDRPDLHAGLARLVKAGDPQNRDEAHALVQEGLLDEWIKSQGAQSDLFGDSPAQSVAIGRAKLRAWLLKSLRSDTRIFGQLVRHADAIEAGGNTLARDANEASLAVTNVALESIAKLGMRAGELGDAMNEAARRIAQGEKPGDVGKGILARVKSAIANGERIDEGRAGLLAPGPPGPGAEEAAGLFDEPGGKGQAGQIAEKPEDVAAEPALAEAEMGDHHPSLFEDIPGDERESAALDHLRNCAPGE